jgi:hypothetical protein
MPTIEPRLIFSRIGSNRRRLLVGHIGLSLLQNKQPDDYLTDEQGTRHLKEPEQPAKAPFIALIMPLEVKGEVALHLWKGRGGVSFNVVSYEFPSAEAKDPAASR